MQTDPTPMRFGLSDSTIIKINSVFAQYPEIDRVTLFGSRAKGNYRPGSDIDLVIFGAKTRFEQLLEIENALDDLLLPWKFDVVLLQHIDNPELIDHINRVGLVFYEK